jgi:hypothetical protein
MLTNQITNVRKVNFMKSKSLSCNKLMKFKYRDVAKHGNAVYICSPYKDDAKINAMRAMHYSRFALDCGKFPIAPQCYLPRLIGGEDPAEREFARYFGLRLLRGCGEMWVFGDIICDGMSREIEVARKQRILIRYFTADFKELCRKC